ncbi:MAG: O-antigen ligase family protein [Acidobacteriota bacterium]
MTASIHPTLQAPVSRRWVEQAVPGSWILLWEFPFWLVFLYSSLVPSSAFARQEWFGIPMRVGDILASLSGLLYGLGLVVQRVVFRRKAPIAILGWLLMLLGYGLLRLWTGWLALEDQLGMSFALLLVVSPPLQAAGLMSAYDAIQARSFLNRFSFLLALVCLLYTAESVLGLGLRADAGQAVNSDFGIQRVRGPLFGASTGYLLLLPAIGWALHNMFRSGSSRFLSVFCMLCLLGAFLGMGSRAGLILLGVFLSTLVLLLKAMKRSQQTALFGAAFAIVVGFVVYSRADTSRLTNLEDNYRKVTHETALNILTDQPALTLILGQGYGSIWTWYRRDSLHGDMIAVGDNTISTPFGPSLYHPHSTLLQLAVEFGVTGLLWLGLLIFTIVRLALYRCSDIAWKIFALALAVSLLSFPFDLFLFKEVRVSSTWWLYVFAALRIQSGGGDRI